MNKQPCKNGWTASLSNGQVFLQEDRPFSVSCWSKLKDLISSEKLKILNLRLDIYGRSIVLEPSDGSKTRIIGYWYSKKIVSISSVFIEFCGIGYIKDGTIYITWVRQDGNVTKEARPLHNIGGVIDAAAILCTNL